MVRLVIRFTEDVRLPKFDFKKGEEWIINLQNEKHKHLPLDSYSVGGGVITPNQYEKIKTN